MRMESEGFSNLSHYILYGCRYRSLFILFQNIKYIEREDRFSTSHLAHSCVRIGTEVRVVKNGRWCDKHNDLWPMPLDK